MIGLNRSSADIEMLCCEGVKVDHGPDIFNHNTCSIFDSVWDNLGTVMIYKLWILNCLVRSALAAPNGQ